MGILGTVVAVFFGIIVLAAVAHYFSDLQRQRRRVEREQDRAVRAAREAQYRERLQSPGFRVWHYTCQTVVWAAGGLMAVAIGMVAFL